MSGSSIFIYHHLGLGDHFICNGIVRALAEKFDKIHLFCKHHNVMTVAQMYEDINVELIPVNDDNDALRRIQTLETDKVFSIGFKGETVDFDKRFYKQVGLDFSERWSRFECNRNKEREERLIQSIGLPSLFALVHEDRGRGYTIDYSKISLPIVSMSPVEGFSMIDWLGVADLASEVHCIFSSFSLLVDSVDLKTDLLFIHNYARKDATPTLLKSWVIL